MIEARGEGLEKEQPELKQTSSWTNMGPINDIISDINPLMRGLVPLRKHAYSNILKFHHQQLRVFR